jgi:hypothetical protein
MYRQSQQKDKNDLTIFFNKTNYISIKIVSSQSEGHLVQVMPNLHLPVDDEL